VKGWFEVRVYGPNQEVIAVYGSLARVVTFARCVACAEQTATELSCYGDVPFLVFDGRGRPQRSDRLPLVLPLVEPIVPRWWRAAGAV